MPRFVITLSAKKEDLFFAKSYNIESSTPPCEEHFIEDFQQYHQGFRDIKVISCLEISNTNNSGFGE
jgi:hypothetical protein